MVQVQVFEAVNHLQGWFTHHDTRLIECLSLKYGAHVNVINSFSTRVGGHSQSSKTQIFNAASMNL